VHRATASLASRQAGVREPAAKICFRCSLEGRGVEFAGETLDTGVCHMAFFSDPDGNAWMLHHRYAPRVAEA
jgi:hypothetical protein